MTYQVLARKFRPLDFDALVGQDHVVRALRHGLDEDRLHHAYLFTGTRGVGKTTIARIVAKGLNCETGVTSTPCGRCSICVEVQENRFIDLIEVDAASRTGVADTRELLENAQYRPSRGRYKVYLIDEVHMLSTAAFNALLKTLEEPPAHVKFLLATTDPKKVPVTVLSRCLQFQLKNIGRERIASHLAAVLDQEDVRVEPGALDVIAAAARGSMRDALSITDQAIAYGQGQLTHADVIRMLGAVGRDEVGAAIAAIQSGEPARVVALCDELAERATDFDSALAELIAELHRLAVEGALDAAHARFAPEAIQLFYQIAIAGYRDINVVPEPRTAFEMTLLRMLAFAPDELSARRVARLDGEPAEPEAAARTTAPTEQAEPSASRGEAATPDASRGTRAPHAADQAAPTRAARIPEELQERQEAQDQPVQEGHPDWYALVDRLDLGGIARSLVEHCVLAANTDDHWRLVLDGSHDTLLNETSRAAIERALGDALGKPVRVTLEAGRATVETPAARRRRVDAENLARAQTIFSNDATVQALVEDFDGRLDHIRPTRAESAGG